MGKERASAPSSFVILCMLDKRLNDDFRKDICLMFMLILSMNTFIILVLGGWLYDDI